VTKGPCNTACPLRSLFGRVTVVAILLLAMGTESALAATLSAAGVAPATTTIEPRIVNGVATSSYPATGALLLFDDPAASSVYGAGSSQGCAACDAADDGELTVDELTKAVAFALGGCPGQ
jgi:hypothetical protein